MNNFGMMLYSSWKEIGENVEWAKGWIGDLLHVLSQVLWVALAIVGAAGAIYAIYVGVKMARADSADAREENKKRLVNIIVSIIVTIVLIITFNLFVPMIIGAFIDQNAIDDPSAAGTTLINAVKLFLR